MSEPCQVRTWRVSRSEKQAVSEQSLSQIGVCEVVAETKTVQPKWRSDALSMATFFGSWRVPPNCR